VAIRASSSDFDASFANWSIMAKDSADIIRRRAVRLVQRPEHPLYLFALRADELLALADISRVSRNDAGDVIGYQRPEVRSHVENIVRYLDSGEVLFPHPLILALDSTTSFTKGRGPGVERGFGSPDDDEIAQHGTIELRVPGPGGRKPAWIVDGQQRALALARSKRPDLPVPVAGFISDDLDTQRTQFVLVNTTRPLPKSILTELLPELSSTLPPHLAAQRAAASLVELLATSEDSPFRGLVRRTSTPADARDAEIVSITVLQRAVQDGLASTTGCFYAYRNVASNETDYDAVLRVLLVFWAAVKQTWPEAWGKATTESRLMHSVGIRAMARLMDQVMVTIDPRATHATQRVCSELALIRDACAWTSGSWPFGMEWNGIQDVPAHFKLLSNHLVRAYGAARRT
jgi:DGQHR domain-containing protein